MRVSGPNSHSQEWEALANSLIMLSGLTTLYTTGFQYFVWQRFCEPGHTKRWTLSRCLSVHPSVCNLVRHVTVAWSSLHHFFITCFSDDRIYMCIPLSDKLSAEDRSFYKRVQPLELWAAWTPVPIQCIMGLLTLNDPVRLGVRVWHVRQSSSFRKLR